jgi:hypothetical protein
MVRFNAFVVLGSLGLVGKHDLLGVEVNIGVGVHAVGLFQTLEEVLSGTLR